jgi:arylsulfatase
MDGRERLVALIALAAAGLAVPGSAADHAPARPNVVMILADDLGFSDLGSYGGEIDTPHLDRLAAAGLRYTQGYNTARCWPSRGALLTGYYAQSIRRDELPGQPGGATILRPPWARLLPQLLEPAGYVSYHSGKWHVDGDPLRQGFARSLRVVWTRDAGGENDYFDAAGVAVDGRRLPAREDFYVTTAVGEHAVECLKAHAAEHPGRPFFQYVAFTAPHFPLQAPQDLIAKYRERYRAGWDAVRAERCRRVRELGIVTTEPAAAEPDVGPPYTPSRKALDRFGPGEIDRPRPWQQLTAEQREFQATKMAIHAAMVELLDRAVGRIVEQLEAMAALDDTLILFVSDNGASAEIMVRGRGHDPALPPGSQGTYLCLGPGWSTCANAPFRRHKTWVHEGGIATPWIVHWPRGVGARGELRRQPVHVIDVVPTVLELAGVTPPAGRDNTPVPPLQGRSFAASLATASAAPQHEALWWSHDGNRAVRQGDWKLVAARGDPWELYDLAADRCETRNLAAAEPGRVAALDAEWRRIAGECAALAGPAEDYEEDPDFPRRRPVRRPDAADIRRRPNIVYVMTDDQGYGDIAAHGNPVLETPHLDRLWRESVRLTEFHASPTCSPTRAALMTGRHEFRSGVTHTVHERERLALSATTLPELLKTAGYTTGIFGKWHLGDEDEYQPGTRGFDRVFIHGAGGIGQKYPGSCGDVPGNSYFDPWVRSDGTFVKTSGYCTDVFFDAALDWIDARRKEGQPFFCYVTPNAPHGPLDCPRGSDVPYRAKLEAAGITDGRQRDSIARFYGMIANIDTNVGRLLAALDEWGIADDTLVVFTTDNGTATGAEVFNAGMRGRKGTVWRGGTRVPSFWRWPGSLPAGEDVAAVTAHLDVLPTLCELAGAQIPETLRPALEGRSLVPLLHDAAAPWPDRRLVTHLGRWDRGQAAKSQLAHCRIREGRWSLVNTQNRPDAWELCDVAADPGETRDVAAAHPDVVARLEAAYDDWWASVQPDLVNENLDGPAENPFKAAYRAQRAATPAESPGTGRE